MLLGQFARVGQLPDHRHAADVRVHGLPILGDEPDHTIGQPRVPPDGPQQGLARIVRTDDQSGRVALR